MPSSPDCAIENHGSVFLLQPQPEQVVAWVEQHIGPENGYQPHFPTIVIEHRYIAEIVEGIQDDGLAVQS
jgi:hypothetical protein